MTAIVGFAVQFWLCKKVRTKLKYIPTYLAVIGWLFILAVALGVFGNMGASFFGEEFVALVFAVFFLPPTVGIIVADVLHLKRLK